MILHQKPGGVQFGQGTGMAWLYQASGIGPDRIVITEGELKSASLDKRAPLLWRDREIGLAHCVVWHLHQNMLAVHFAVSRPTQTRLEEDGGCDHIIAVPRISVGEIGCPTCELWFTPRRAPCSCLESASVILAKKVSIHSVLLLDDRHDDIDRADGRSQLLQRFFGNAVTAIQVEDGPRMINP